MNEGNTSRRAQTRAGSIRYASALAVLQESLQQLGDVIRLQAAEYDRLTSGSLNIGEALNAWRYSTTLVMDALARFEGAHAALDALTPDVLNTITKMEKQAAADETVP